MVPGFKVDKIIYPINTLYLYHLRTYCVWEHVSTDSIRSPSGLFNSPENAEGTVPLRDLQIMKKDLY